MLRQTIFAVMLLVTGIAQSHAQGVEGDWQGELEVQPGVTLPLVLHVDSTDSVWQVSLDSPDQGAFGIEGKVITATDTLLKVAFPAIGASYQATLNNVTLSGTFTQAGTEFSLILKRQSSAKAAAGKAGSGRPQHPTAPFPYVVEDVTYPHVSGEFEFAATLTKPEGKGPFPAVILVSGSGPQDRDETLMGHKPFLVLADHLTKAGVAVLRFDDRGTAHSGGVYQGTTITGFSTDVESAFGYLSDRSDIDASQIGLLGHSEGGVIAPVFAARQPEVAFVVLLAGLGVDGKTLWAEQQRDIAAAYGHPNASAVYTLMSDIAQRVIDGSSAAQIKQQLLNAGYEAPVAQQYTSLIANEWGRSFFTYQPADVLAKLNMPVLALNGDKDIQVAAATNMPAMQAIFAQAGHNDVTLLTLPGQNHLFQEADTGLPDEYGKLTQTMAPATLTTISEWITARVDN
ncbi:alpha/beta hydrolase family protein [Alteromonas gilva]|uniref:Alpha/beta hydrolase n=1 Tax=Alteromonas gilva TaxID=2987522 RepID=A0ABT5KXE0_9ALTE|nr:alpha/beta fold hydrolase [Alteromonas gilva]MDC8829435.1 alpha/beta hydrolase [Alteromonas gilva]